MVTNTQLNQIVEVANRQGIRIPADLAPTTRSEGDRLVRALLYIDGDKGLDADLGLVERLEATRPDKEEPIVEDTKTCTLCGEEKPLSDYYKNQGRCKPCYNRVAKERAAAKAAKDDPKDDPTPSPADPKDDPTPSPADPAWVIAMRDPRWSTVRSCREILATYYEGIDLEDTAGILYALSYQIEEVI